MARYRPADLTLSPSSPYAGSKACQACHPAEYATWRDSYHRTMTQEVREGTVLADFDDVTKITIYTTDIDAYRETGDVRAEYWTSAPASTLVQIDRLARPVFLVEIEATAIAPE